MHTSGYLGLHAEQAAIWSLGKKETRGTIMFVVRVRRNGTLGMAKPCRMCMDMIKAAGVKRIYYSTADGRIACIR
jgi:deoxycytidylate deaminase